MLIPLALIRLAVPNRALVNQSRESPSFRLRVSSDGKMLRKKQGFDLTVFGFVHLWEKSKVALVKRKKNLLSSEQIR